MAVMVVDPASPHDDYLRYARSGDAAALERALRAASAGAYAQAYRTLGRASDADDAVQEAFLQAARSARRFDGGVPFAGWIGRLVHLACLRVRRARRRTREVTLDPRLEAASLQPDAAADADAVRAALAALPERYRAPLELHHLGGIPYAEAAAALGLTVSALGVRLHRGRELLRRRLERAGIGAGADAAVALAVITVAPPAHVAADTAATAIAAKAAAAALPATTIPLSLTASGAALMAAHPILVIAIVAALAVGSLAVPLTARAAESAPEPAPVTSAPPASGQSRFASPLPALTARQLPDGSWPQDFGDPTPLATAEVVLCFLGAGYDHRTRSEHAATVEKALRSIVASVRVEDGVASTFVPAQAMVVMALCEAYAMTGDPALAEPAARAYAALLAQRIGSGAWPVVSGDVDQRASASASAHAVMAIVSAAASGIGKRDDALPTDAWFAQTWERWNVGGGRPRFPSVDDGAETPAPDVASDPAAAMILATMGRHAHEAAAGELTRWRLASQTEPDVHSQWFWTLGILAGKNQDACRTWRARIEPKLRRDQVPDGPDRGCWLDQGKVNLYVTRASWLTAAIFERMDALAPVR